MSENIKQNAKKTEAKRGSFISRKPKKRLSHAKNKNLPVEQVLHLQRTIGNRALTRLIRSGTIQAKLTVGKPDSIYEKEADSVADRVMSMKDGSLVNGHSSLAQRETAGEEEKEEVQTKSLAEQITPLIRRQVEEEEQSAQTKLLQRQEGEEEKEAQTKIQRQAEEEEKPAQTKLLQRQEGEEEKEAQTKLQRQAEEEEKPAQPKAAQGSTREVTSNIESNINEMKGGGQLLSESTRAFFEPRFGADFSQVRIHNNSKAADTTQAINAKAFTTGKDIAFNSGQYSPGTSSGKRLLAHELTHVVQQEGVQRSPIIPASHSMESNHIHTMPAAAVAMGVAEWIGAGAAGYVIAQDAVSAGAGDITYSLPEMQGVLTPGGGNNVENYLRDNPNANIQSRTHKVAVWKGYANSRRAGIKFGITYRYDGHAIGNISCNILDTYDWPLWGGNVDVNFTQESFATGNVATIRITISITYYNDIIGEHVGSTILELSADGKLEEVPGGENEPFLEIRLK
jgi:hypothetical protein